MASHIYTVTPDVCGATDGTSASVFLWCYDQPVMNGDVYQHGPLNPAQARDLAIELLHAAKEAEELAESMGQA